MIAAKKPVDEAYQCLGRKPPDYLLERTVEYIRFVLLFGHEFMLHENCRCMLPGNEEWGMRNSLTDVKFVNMAISNLTMKNEQLVLKQAPYFS
jgi:hypothetical protein